MRGILMFLAATIMGCSPKGCQNVSFCEENFNLLTNYSVINDNYLFNSTHFTFLISGQNNFENISMTISFPQEIGIRIKADHLNREEYLHHKYDISTEDSIVNQTIFEKFKPFHLSTSEYNFQLGSSEISIKINFIPFTIEFLKSNSRVAIINQNQNLIFGLNDPTGIDITLTGKQKHFFSGLGFQTQLFNIDDHIYRLYNSNDFPKHSSIPFIISHCSMCENVGFFWANPSDTFVRCHNNSIHFLSETGFLDLYIFIGSFDAVQSNYSTLTGKPFFPPVFSLGYHQSRHFYNSQNEVYSAMELLKEFHIPFDSIWLGINHLAHFASFSYNETTFSHPKKLISSVLADGRYLVRFSSPFLPIDVNNKQSEEAFSSGYLVNQNGNKSAFVFPLDDNEFTFPDFLNKDVINWWAQQFDYSVDFSSSNVFYWSGTTSDYFSKDTVFSGGYEGRDVHNIYGHLMTSAISKGVISRNSKNLRPYLVALDIFSGSQKFAFTWSGRHAATWEGLRASLAQVVSGGVSGFPFIGSDVCGCEGTPSEELIVRWFQLGAWTYPFFRQESSPLSSGCSEPYRYDGLTFTCIQSAIQQRYKHILIWYSALRNSNLTGSPIVKPLWAFPKISELLPQSHTLDDQVILADTFMLAPIIEQNQSVRMIVKPPGRWFCYPGGYEIKESTSFLVSIMDTPIFLLGGKIILVFQKSGANAIETLNGEDLDMYIALDENKKAKGVSFLDDGISFDYLNGSFLESTIEFESGWLRIRNKGDQKSTFAKNLKIRNIFIFGLNEKPSIILKYETAFNDYRLNIRIPDNHTIYLCQDINLKVYNQKNNPMKVATITIAAILGFVVICLLVLIPFFLIRRENIKKKSENEPSSDMKNPILNNESI